MYDEATKVVIFLFSFIIYIHVAIIGENLIAEAIKNAGLLGIVVTLLMAAFSGSLIHKILVN